MGITLLSRFRAKNNTLKLVAFRISEQQAMNRHSSQQEFPGRDHTNRAVSADSPLVAWVARMSIRERIEIKHRLAERTLHLETDPHFARRVDREESARAAALFLEYARQHRLAPAEVESLLRHAAHDATQALDELDGSVRGRPTQLPGRHASGRTDATTSSRAPSAGRDGSRRR